MSTAKVSRLRSQLDDMDNELLSLINQRQSISMDIQQIKVEEGIACYDETRERKVTERLLLFNRGPLLDHEVLKIWQILFSGSRLYHSKKLMRKKNLEDKGPLESY